jgi:serine/threonine-protein kinase PBS1
LFSDRKQLPRLADPRLGKCYPMRALYQALSVASMCIHENSANRPHISDVVTALTFLAQSTDSTPPSTDPTTPTTGTDSNGNENGNCSASSSGVGSRANGGEEPENRGIAVVFGGAGGNKGESDRERLVAEAKQWGQNWRQKMKGQGMSSGEG